MSEEHLLTLINSPDKLPEPRNYWNTSGLKREFFPTEASPDCVPTLNRQGRVEQEPSNPWWINSREHHYCFWSYLKDKSQPDGAMEPLLQSEIAKLMGCSITKLHFLLKEAMENLMSDENMGLLQDLEDLAEPEPEDVENSNSLSTLYGDSSSHDEDEAKDVNANRFTRF